jgi:pimeloyl-ACP methyl ester carboxylesterase
MNVHHFEIAVPQDRLNDLAERLSMTDPKLPSAGGGWDAGADPAYMQKLLDHWLHAFDWRAQEAQLNQLAHYRASVSGLAIHYIHERARTGSGLPLLLTHGYPDSFLRFRKLIPLLTDPGAHGADPNDAFDVVVPSLPGYAFSEAPDRAGSLFSIAGLWHELMTSVLGYTRFGAHGGDWGSTVTEHLARSHSDSVIGIHLTDVPFWHALQKPDDVSASEAQFLRDVEQFQLREGAYALIQGTRPQTLADTLFDSPFGLAAWIADKLQRWSDCNGDLDTRFSKDEVLTQVMLYWCTDTIGSSFRPYYDVMHAGAPRWILEKLKEKLGSAETPAGFAMSPKDLIPPREWAERFFNVQRWSELPRGGHFAAHEEPELLAHDIREFFRPLRRTQ